MRELSLLNSSAEIHMRRASEPREHTATPRDRVRNDFDNHVSAAGFGNTCEGRAASMSPYEAGDGLCSLLSYRANGTDQLRLSLRVGNASSTASVASTLQRPLIAPSFASRNSEPIVRPRLPTPTQA